MESYHSEKENQDEEIKEKEKEKKEIEVEKSKIEQNKEIIYEKKYIGNSTKNKKNDNKNKIILPNFENGQILIKDYSYYSYCKDYHDVYESCYDIYNMKSNQNLIYIAYINYKMKLAILKYDIFNMKSKIIQIKLEEISKSFKRNQISQIKYFYNPLTDKEYLFTFYKTKLLIYLIKSEDHYILIKKHKQKAILGCAHQEEKKLPIYYFKIFHNTYLKKIF